LINPTGREQKQANNPKIESTIKQFFDSYPPALDIMIPPTITPTVGLVTHITINNIFAIPRSIPITLSK